MKTEKEIKRRMEKLDKIIQEGTADIFTMQECKYKYEAYEWVLKLNKSEY